MKRTISNKGSHFCTWVIEEGDLYKTMRCSEDDFAQWKLAGEITYWGDIDPDAPGAEPYRIKPLALWLSRIEDNYDFSLKESW